MQNDNSFVKECVVKSLVELMKEKGLKDISITEITKKAGVSRMSYYRNYYCKEDILNNYLIDILKKYDDKRQELINKNKYSMYHLILYAFEFFEEYKDFVITVEKSNLSNIMQNKITEYMAILYPFSDDDVKARYHLYIFSGSLYNSCKMWLLGGLKEDPKELATIFVNRMFKNNVTDA